MQLIRILFTSGLKSANPPPGYKVKAKGILSFSTIGKIHNRL
jgi:hypothetical protein